VGQGVFSVRILYSFITLSWTQDWSLRHFWKCFSIRCRFPNCDNVTTSGPVVTHAWVWLCADIHRCTLVNTSVFHDGQAE